jgi:beta-lactamase class A
MKIFLLAAAVWLSSLPQQYGAESIGIYLERPDGSVFEHNADEIFHAASTMKVPVMMEAFRQAEKNELSLDTQVTIKNEFSSIVDGSPYSLTAEEDSDMEIYKLIGHTMTMRDLIVRMINQSSNLATNIVIEKVKAEKVRKLMEEIGARDMRVLRGVEDLKAYEAGKNNQTSARALGLCYKAILNPKLFSSTSRDQMINILLSQTSLAGIHHGLKANENGLKVASKDGWITEINHDSAIIQDKKGKNWIMVIMTRGVEKQEDGYKLISDLANAVWKDEGNKE